MKYFREAFENAETPEQIEARRLEQERLSQKGREKASNKVACPYNVGEEVKGKGIYFGTLSFIKAQCYAFADHHDLTRVGQTLWTFKDAAEEISKRTDYRYGHAGWYQNGISSPAPELSLEVAISKGKYKGEWIIPNDEMLIMLYEAKDLGEFKGTFATQPAGEQNAFRHRYWSCTGKVLDCVNGAVVHGLGTLSFDTGAQGKQVDDGTIISCRACRLERMPEPV
jgi:hypothetical protein